MNKKLDIRIFESDNGHYILKAEGCPDELLTEEVLLDDQYLAYYLRRAIKKQQKQK